MPGRKFGAFWKLAPGEIPLESPNHDTQPGWAAPTVGGLNRLKELVQLGGLEPPTSGSTNCGLVLKALQKLGFVVR